MTKINIQFHRPIFYGFILVLLIVNCKIYQLQMIPCCIVELNLVISERATNLLRNS
ncbi:hypothetical protein HanIR_Chr14g0718581 [Helianthus annuus]|nr:hypothetical protein HanIR_Chr14g0718581 [Helianthus annuus]